MPRAGLLYLILLYILATASLGVGNGGQRCSAPATCLMERASGSAETARLRPPPIFSVRPRALELGPPALPARALAAPRGGIGWALNSSSDPSGPSPLPPAIDVFRPHAGASGRPATKWAHSQAAAHRECLPYFPTAPPLHG